MRADLRDGTDSLDVIQRDRDIEVVLELGDQLEDQQGIEAEIQYEIAVRHRLDRPAADPLHDRDDLRFDRATGNAHRFLRIADRSGGHRGAMTGSARGWSKTLRNLQSGGKHS